MRSWREKKKKKRRKTLLGPAETERLSKKLADFYLFILRFVLRLSFVRHSRRGGGRRWWALMICEPVCRCLPQRFPHVEAGSDS